MKQDPQFNPPPAPGRTQAMRSLLLGGVIPVVVFTLVEQYYGTLAGLIAGMVFGVGEIIAEKITQKRVDTITWIGNGMLIGLGLISIFTHQGIWFKLQPSLLEAGMAVMLFGSVILGKPLLVMMAHKQRLFERMPPGVAAYTTRYFRGFTLRIGVFFLFHAAIAAWAALHWSTEAWAILKGVGFTGTMIVYMLLETVVMRRRMVTSLSPQADPNPIAPPSKYT